MDHVDTPQTWTATPQGFEPLITYWRVLRRGHLVPARADLDPSALGPWLNMSGLVEIGSGGRARFRVGGQGLSALLGVEARGMPLRSLFALGTRDRLQDLVQRVFSGPSMLHMTLIAPARAAEARPVQLPVVMLPLRDQDGAVTRALFCMESRAAMAVQRPARFHIRQARLSMLTAASTDTPLLRLIPGGRDGCAPAD